MNLDDNYVYIIPIRKCLFKLLNSVYLIPGLFYASIYPKKVKKAIYLDIGPAVKYCDVRNHERFFKESYEDFYENCSKYDVYRESTKEIALRSVLNARAVNEEEAELLLSRCLIQTGPNTYR